MNARPAVGALDGQARPQAADTLDLRIAESEAELLSLEPEWNELLEDSSASVFQSFDWVSTWWRYFGSGHALHCLCFRRAGRLVGIAPLYRERVRAFGVVAVARLRFIGRGLADYGDLVVRKGFEPGVIAAFAAHLGDGRARWDLCDLEDLNESSEVLRRLPGLLDGEAVVLSAYQGSVCPQRRLPATWEAFLQSVGPKLRGNLKRNQKKLGELFDTRVEVFADPSSDLEAAVDAFAEIHGARWRGVGFPSAFDDAHHRGFHLEVARRFASRGWLRLSFINVDGVRVAVSFDFLYRRRIYVYQCNAAGPAEVMKWSPGGLVKAASIRAGIEDGMEVYDLLRGDEAYKISEWKCVPTKNYLLRLVNRRGARLRSKAFFAWELLQKGVERLRREYYGFRQFTTTRDPSLPERARWVLARLGVLWRLGAGYVARNLGGRSADEQREGARGGDDDGGAGGGA